MAKPEKKTFEDVELPSNPNLPAWMLTPKEEKLIFERWRKKAFLRCDELIKKYIECTNSYSALEAMTKCQTANNIAQGCVAKYQKVEYLDIERDILIKEKAEKRKLYRESLKATQNEA